MFAVISLCYNDPRNSTCKETKALMKGSRYTHSSVEVKAFQIFIDEPFDSAGRQLNSQNKVFLVKLELYVFVLFL